MDIKTIQSRGKKFIPALTLGFFILVVYLLYQNLSTVRWIDVQSALLKLSLTSVLVALGIAFTNYLVLTTYDYMGLRFFKIHQMTYPRVLASAFTCYVFNLNLGALIGGIGFRYRIYSGWKVPKNIIPMVVLFSTLTNWLGHMTLLSVVFCFKAQMLHSLFSIPAWSFVTLGVLCLATVLAYFLTCLLGKKIKIKGKVHDLPSFRLALVQTFMGTLNWSSIAAIIYFLLRELGAEVDYGHVLFTTLIASVVGVLAHIPAGLGVIEATFLRMEFNIPTSDLLVALLCYRGVYYLIPLLIALPGYLGLEMYQKRLK